MTNEELETPAFDKKRPVEKEGYTTCAACWEQKENTQTRNWTWFKFKYLEGGWLCPVCFRSWGDHYNKLQAAGL